MSAKRFVVAMKSVKGIACNTSNVHKRTAHHHTLVEMQGGTHQVWHALQPMVQYDFSILSQIVMYASSNMQV